jgi:mannose-6-phosphate isomerase
MYPLKFEPIYKEKIWGGTALAKQFSRELPGDSIGESWELAAHQEGSSIVANGKYAGKKLMEVVEAEGVDLLGSNARPADYEKFPLLIKFLDANDKLSVQVHPDDNYAAKHADGELGKTEMWYVIDAEEDAQLVYGVEPEVSKEEFAQAIEDGTLQDKLREINVQRGDVLYIPSGTVHAIKEGIVLAEIQQNSDTTYRVYDWDRVGKDGKPRQLHIESALEVIKFGEEPRGKVAGLEMEDNGARANMLVSCPYFTVETLDIDDTYKGKTRGERFYILMGLKGKSKLIYGEGELDLKAGETVLIPANLGKYQLQGDAKVIQTYIKAPAKVKQELTEQDYSKEEIEQIAGL